MNRMKGILFALLAGVVGSVVMVFLLGRSEAQPPPAAPGPAPFAGSPAIGPAGPPVSLPAPSPHTPKPPPPPSPSPPATIPTKVNSVWAFSIETKEGRMVLLAKAHGREFKVTSDTVDLKAPRGEVVAQGKVEISGPNVEASAEKLTIGFAEDRLVIEGKAKVRCRTGAADNVEDVEVLAEKFTLRVTEGPRPLPRAKESERPSSSKEDREPIPSLSKTPAPPAVPVSGLDSNLAPLPPRKVDKE